MVWGMVPPQAGPHPLALPQLMSASCMLVILGKQREASLGGGFMRSCWCSVPAPHGAGDTPLRHPAISSEAADTGHPCSDGRCFVPA